MIEIGRTAIKIAGRDAGKKCIIIDILDNKFVLIDGETRRRKCNILHLEPLDKVIQINKNADHNEIIKVFKDELNIELKEKKPKQKTERPRNKRPTERRQEATKQKPKEKKGLFRKKKTE